HSAPEIFQSSGYDYAVDWWSLGVTMYEVLRHKRPFHIEQNTTDEEIAVLHRDGSISFPVDWDQAVMNLFFKFFKVDPQRRIQSFDDLASDEFCGSMSRDDVIEMKVATEFQPSRKELNYDPTFELEEMIMESNPLHKKKHRLEKLKSRRRNEKEWEKEWEHLGAKFQPFNRRRYSLV
uniref:Protein kinase domain-containing protein n=1 Tax=Ciona savignyi TaxID=51511 RepID=H2YXH7_CIOSA